MNLRSSIGRLALSSVRRSSPFQTGAFTRGASCQTELDRADQTEPADQALVAQLLPGGQSACPLPTAQPQPGLARVDRRLDVDLDPFTEHLHPDAMRLFQPAPRVSFNLAAYANELEALRRLADLGVQLCELEADRKAAELLLRLDFERDVQPRLRLLAKHGVGEDRLGALLTGNVWLLDEPLENLRVRLAYLASRRFTPAEVTEMVCRHPRLLSTPVRQVDERLGFYQKQLQLKDAQLRQMMVNFPRMVALNAMSLQETRFALVEEMGFTPALAKQILVVRPGLMRKSAFLICFHLLSLAFLRPEMKFLI